MLVSNSCQHASEVQLHRLSGQALGTTYHISYIGQEIDQVESRIDSIVFAINHGLSTYQSNSLITCFNTNDNSLWSDSTEVSYFERDMAHFKFMVKLSKEISEKTNGVFDPSAACLFEEYASAQKSHRLMDQEQLDFCLSHQGMDKVVMDSLGYPVKLDSFVQLNFNAIAKGYLVDIIGDYLTKQSINHYLVEVGGEVTSRGKNKSNESWKLGIAVPEIASEPTDFFEVVELSNQALATSGNYQNFYRVNGKLLGHTMNPKTGKPVINSLRSASVFNTSCAVADAYATACMVLGYEKSCQLIANDSTLSAYLIREEEGNLVGHFVD